MRVTATAEVLGAVAVGSVLAYAILFSLLRARLNRRGGVLVVALVHHVRRAALWAVLLGALEVATIALPLHRDTEDVLVHTVGTALVVAVAWLAVKVTYVVDDIILSKHPLDISDNLRARQLKTQVELFRRVAAVLICVVALAFILLSYPEVRAVGAGLLASAGLVGLVAGVAAQPLAANVVAGIQIAITQPIRIDDVVVIAGDWGRIEEIHLTYAVVQVWDMRRLIVPISFFTSQSFENWTRSSAAKLGWAYIEVDYSAPVDAIREKFNEICAESPNWDGQVAVLQVSNAGLTMQLRALVSTADSGRAWDLQCEVREKIIAFLQQEYPWALPRLRAEVAPPAPQSWAAPSGRSGSASEPPPPPEPPAAPGPSNGANSASGANGAATPRAWAGQGWSPGQSGQSGQGSSGQGWSGQGSSGQSGQGWSGQGWSGPDRPAPVPGPAGVRP